MSQAESSNHLNGTPSCDEGRSPTFLKYLLPVEDCKLPKVFKILSEYHYIHDVLSLIEKARKVRKKFFRNDKFREVFTSTVLSYPRNNKEIPSSMDNSKSSLNFILGACLFYFPEVSQLIVSRYPQLYRPISHRKLCKDSHKTVIIIGAGISGLAAAKTLTEAGIENFQILEAHSHPGGRIRSLKFGAGYAELGAQWLHGTQSSLYDFANSKDLLSPSLSYEGQGPYLRKGGEIVPDILVFEIDEVVRKILEECEKYYHSTKNEDSISVGQYLNEKFENYLRSCREDSSDFVKLKKELFDWHLRFQIIDNSCRSLDDLSLNSWGQFQSCGSENINIKSKYSDLIDTILEELPSSCITYNTPVLSVDWATNNKIKVATTSGEYQCDHVIVTCSVGFINANQRSFFTPNLPDSYIKGFESFGFGTINKVFLYYEDSWWKDVQGMQLVWDSVFDNLQVESEDDMNWTRGVTGFDVVVGLPNVLLCWVGGIGAEIMELLPDESIASHCTALLEMFLGREVPMPLDIVRSKWNGNKYIRGSYSYLKVSSHQTDSKATANLLSPIYTRKNGEKVPSVLFAGEALHHSHYSTVHGAYDTGVSQAKKLIDFLVSDQKRNIFNIYGSQYAFLGVHR